MPAPPILDFAEAAVGGIRRFRYTFLNPTPTVTVRSYRTDDTTGVVAGKVDATDLDVDAVQFHR